MWRSARASYQQPRHRHSPAAALLRQRPAAAVAAARGPGGDEANVIGENAREGSSHVRRAAPPRHTDGRQPPRRRVAGRVAQQRSLAASCSSASRSAGDASAAPSASNRRCSASLLALAAAQAAAWAATARQRDPRQPRLSRGERDHRRLEDAQKGEAAAMSASSAGQSPVALAKGRRRPPPTPQTTGCACTSSWASASAISPTCEKTKTSSQSSRIGLAPFLATPAVRRRRPGRGRWRWPSVPALRAPAAAGRSVETAAAAWPGRRRTVGSPSSRDRRPACASLRSRRTIDLPRVRRSRSPPWTPVRPHARQAPITVRRPARSPQRRARRRGATAPACRCWCRRWLVRLAIVERAAIDATQPRRSADAVSLTGWYVSARLDAIASARRASAWTRRTCR